MASKTPVSASSSSGKHIGLGIAQVLFGLLFLLVFLDLTATHIRTSEAFFLSGHVVPLFSNNMSILEQPIQIWEGTLPIALQEAAIWAWVVELIFLTSIIGFEAIHSGVKRSSHVMAKVYVAGMVIISLFDGWSDFQYGNVASGFWGQLAFAVATAFGVIFFAISGIMLISDGFHKFS